MARILILEGEILMDEKLLSRVIKIRQEAVKTFRLEIIKTFKESLNS